MEIKKIQFSELVKEMRQVVKNLGNYAVLDTLTDIEQISKEYEECAEVSAHTHEDIDFYYYWCVRENGTALKDLLMQTNEWYRANRKDAISIYKIGYKNGGFFFELHVDFSSMK